jgi:short-subunit dehydrogenase
MAEKDTNTMNIAILGCGNIGFETACLLCKSNHSILIVDSHYHDHVHHFVSTQVNVRFEKGNALDSSSIQSILDRVYSNDTEIDILISTVGAYSDITPMINYESFIANFELNFFANLIPIKSVLPRMVRQRFGRIIVMSSTSGHHARAELSAYGPSKWALESVCESLRSEVKAYGITVDVVCPRTIRNKYSLSFSTNTGISAEIVAGKIVSLIDKPKNTNHFVPSYYFLMHVVERLAPSFLDKRFGKKENWRRKVHLDNLCIESVLITGASSGLGKELAVIYSARAKRLYLIGRSFEKLVQVQSDLKTINPSCEVTIDSVDMADADQVKGYCRSLDNIDLIINNAATSVRGLILETTVERYVDTLRTNFYGPVLLISEFMKKEQTPKKIINVLSTTAIAGRKNHSCYSSTKAALWSFTRSMRRVFGNKIQVIEIIASTFPSSLGIMNETKASTQNRGEKAGIFQPKLTATMVAKKILVAETGGLEVLYVPMRAKLFALCEAVCPSLFRKFFR